MSWTVVSFHAHPDDEALLVSGTLARAAAQGHRVVVVVATAGEAGLAEDRTDLGDRRLAELEASAAAIGAARVEVLGYADSGWPAPIRGRGTTFATTDARRVAEDLAAILVEEEADVLTIYDPAGGYGHPDHVQVHRAGLVAAAIAGTPVVLEATIDRQSLQRAVGWLARLARVLPLPALPTLDAAYTARADLTHRVDVRDHLSAKRASMRAHASQATGDGGARTLALLLRLPAPLARRVLGTEWFREVGRAPGRPLLDDVFASLR
ncbi:PIG-L family deacetylase [Nocardioides sp. LS1]|uniref:PIG-L family deacetylase n=1 Tax=Nocardioides sp. LS1 TaxID=1027620 RepID=UPI000F61A7E8|nr:PIG-L family deacetylase [Nocardioides sp. LS1]GCD90267.1 GlcNAc-PI de-N-acetylase [Nocardioides sp. LS1]